MLRIQIVLQGINDGRVEEVVVRKNLDWYLEFNFDFRGERDREIDIFEVVKIEQMVRFFFYFGIYKGKGRYWVKRRIVFSVEDIE